MASFSNPLNSQVLETYETFAGPFEKAQKANKEGNKESLPPYLVTYFAQTTSPETNDIVLAGYSSNCYFLGEQEVTKLFDRAVTFYDCRFAGPYVGDLLILKECDRLFKKVVTACKDVPKGSEVELEFVATKHLPNEHGLVVGHFPHSFNLQNIFNDLVKKRLGSEASIITKKIKVLENVTHVKVRFITPLQ